MKDIVFIADFCGPLNGTFNSRFLYLADILAKGNWVEIITSDFDHDAKKYFTYEPEKHDYCITMLHEGAYPKNVCIRRFIGHYIWGKNVKKYLKKRKKPDVIFCPVPPLKAPKEAAKYCEKNGIRFVADIQDLWPEAFRMVLNIPVISSMLFYPLSQMANAVYSRADVICAVSETYGERALRVNEKCSGSTIVYLGTDLNTFDRNAAGTPMLQKENIDEVWLAYCGTLGSSYDLTCVIDALDILGNESIRFIVMGDGPRRAEFENYTKEKGVRATFTGNLKYNEMCSLLTHCDITVNPITHNAAQSIINKHADYAASGLPVVSTQESEEYRKLVDDYQMGFNCRNNDAADLAEKLNILILDPTLREQMGRNARRCAEERFDRKNSYQALVEVITE